MIATAVRTAPARLVFWPAAAVALLLVAAGTGVAPIAPFFGLVAFAAFLAAPMRVTALAVFALLLVADNPGERPADGFWESPLFPVGKFLYLNLNSVTGIAPLRFSAIELIVAALGLLIVVRKAINDPIDDPLRLGLMPNTMKVAFSVLFGTVVWLELYGLARGGDFRNSLWQMRQMLWFPVLGVVFGNAIKSASSRVWLLRIVLGVAWLRCLQGAYFYFVIARRLPEIPDYATTHSDSMLTVVAILIGLTAMAERPSWNHLLMNLFFQPMLFLGLVVNNRRLAFVNLAFGLAALVLMGPASLRRFLKRSLMVMIPLALIYVAVGWNSKAGIFKPVSMIKSVSSQEDASSKTRDIENYNLIQTLKPRPLLGSGFGHEYNEVVRAFDVADVFAQYRYIAHNSVLWILSIAGGVGFTLLWAIYPVSLLVALKVHRKAVTSIDRVTAFATVVAVMCFVLQAWGDMGLMSWMGTLIVTSLMGATAALATSQRQMETHA